MCTPSLHILAKGQPHNSDPAATLMMESHAEERSLLMKTRLKAGTGYGAFSGRFDGFLVLSMQFLQNQSLPALG